MPIKPENAHRYPKDWPAIRARIVYRAGYKCEWCGVHNGALGGRTRDGKFLPALSLGERLLRIEWPRPGDEAWCGEGEHRERLRIIRIVLTVAHMDHQPENCADENLKALCQRCHLTYDAEHHAQTAYATRRQGKAVTDLFADEAPGT